MDLYQYNWEIDYKIIELKVRDRNLNCGLVQFHRKD